MLAQEILEKKPSALAVLDELSAEGALGQREWLSHEQFKALSRQARAIVRTGECQPYCNIALIAGVTF
ncbi:D-ribose pyranase [compost metagenome]